MNLKQFVEVLETKNMLKRIKKAVDTKYEIATIMKILDGKPLLFENVKNHKMQIIANICSTRELVALGLNCKENEIISKLANAIDSPKEPEIIKAKGYKEISADLTKLPILTYYPKDGGAYITSSIVIANDNEFGINASYHRCMVIGKDKLVIRILERHFDKYLKRGLKEFAICIGNSIPIMLASAISLEKEGGELAIANALNKTELIEIANHKVPRSEIVLICETTSELADEGPFLDLTETFDIIRKQRVAKVKKIFLREDSLFHALLPGGLEHKVLMGMPREPTIFREVNKVVECKDVYITPGGTSWLHGVVSIKKKNEEDGKKAISSAFKGHRSMKHVFIVDEDIDIHNPNEVEWAFATRFQGDNDIIINGKSLEELYKDSIANKKDRLIEREKGSSLDPSSDMKTALTTKIGFDLTIKKNSGKDFKKPELPMKIKIEDYL